jgi:hypothetical protein
MNRDSSRCPVCGGTMNRLNMSQSKSSRLVRFKCTCGHSEDLKDDKPLLRDGPQESLALEGFQELP